MNENDSSPNQPETPTPYSPPTQQPVPPQQQVVSPQPVQATENPGQVFGIISIILPFVGLSIVGIVLGVISRNKSKKANMSTTLGTVGLIISIVTTVLVVVTTVLWIALAVFVGSNADTSTDSSRSLDSSQQEQSTMEDGAEHDHDHSDGVMHEAEDLTLPR